MSRLILMIVIFGIVYFLLKSYSRKEQLKDQAPPPPKAQDMVSCAFCGVHLPKSESLFVGGKYYCCTAHSRNQAE
jgi:uncharacterized protein